MKHHLKLIKQVIAISFSLILWLCPVFSVLAENMEVPNGLYAAGAVLMDGDSGRVLFSKAGDEAFAMASTTKIMTCILGLELGAKDQIVTFSKNAASMPDVQMNAKEGERYYLKDLLYSTMLESHNDSAVAVAEAIAGTVENFTKLMNQKAEAIGCTNTHFVTPNGLDGANEGGEHRTSAKELAMILRYCISVSSKAPEFLEITKTRTYEFRELDGKRYVSCSNHNAFLDAYEGAFTGKTGFTGKAGYCYTGAAQRDDRTLIVALLGSGWYPNRSYKWKDAKKLLDYGFENYHYVKIGKENWDLPHIKVINGMKEDVKLTTDAKTFEFLLGKEETVNCKINYAKALSAPTEPDALVGVIRYELDGNIIEQFHIYTAEAIEKATVKNKAKKWVNKLSKWLGEQLKQRQNT